MCVTTVGNTGILNTQSTQPISPGIYSNKRSDAKTLIIHVIILKVGVERYATSIHSIRNVMDVLKAIPSLAFRLPWHSVPLLSSELKIGI